MLTRKHFVALAASIARIENSDSRKAAALAACVTCAESNGRFRKDIFLRACGVKQS